VESISLPIIRRAGTSRNKFFMMLLVTLLLVITGLTAYFLSYQNFISNQVVEEKPYYRYQNEYREFNLNRVEPNIEKELFVYQKNLPDPFRPYDLSESPDLSTSVNIEGVKLKRENLPFQYIEKESSLSKSAEFKGVYNLDRKQKQWPYILKGIVMSKESNLAVFEVSEDVIILCEGDIFEGFKVTEITKGEVVLRQEGCVITISVEDW